MIERAPIWLCTRCYRATRVLFTLEVPDPTEEELSQTTRDCVAYLHDRSRWRCACVSVVKPPQLGETAQ